MSDSLARRIASLALALSLVALALAIWSVGETQNRDARLRELTSQLERLLEIRERNGVSRPPLVFDEGGTTEAGE